MADTQETIADIIAWLRKPREGENAYLTLWRDEIADRLEAAWKREKAAIEADALAVGGIVEASRKRERGDGAKLREALSKSCAYFAVVLNTGMFNRVHLEALLNMAKAALAAPPRNCDVYNNESCRMAYHLHGDGLMTMQAFADWLFAPATEKEGGAK